VTVKLFDGALFTYSTGPTGTNELTSVNRNGALTAFGYDANGNVVNRATSSSNAPYAFDLENRLVKACTASPCTSSNTYTFAYDGLGDRVQETGPSGSQTYTNTYVASGNAMLYLKNVVGSTTTKTVYLYAGSLLVATVSGATKSYFHEDHLGNTRLVTQGGSVVFSTNYEPFGRQYAASGSDPSVKYTGQWAEALGLYWNHARYYDPTLGRFVSADPVLGHLRNPQTLDRYAYARNNPLALLDPTGLDGIDWGALGAVVAGALIVAGAVALCTTGVGCIVTAIVIAGVVGAAVDVAITAAQGNQVTVGTAVNGAFMGLLGGAIVLSVAQPELLPAEIGAAAVDERLAAGEGFDAAPVLGAAPPTDPAPGVPGMPDGGGLEGSPPAAAEPWLEPPGGVTTIGAGEDVPLQSTPQSLVRGIGQQGELRKLAFYDENGNILERIDAVGQTHGGISTPHVQAYDWVQTAQGPLGGWGYRLLDVRPTADWENFLIDYYGGA
jgi:RHS repeat-associated protein